MSAGSSLDGTIAFIGGGRMGEAIIQSLLARRLVEPDQIVACDIAAERRQHLARTHRIRTTADGAEAVASAAVVVLAVKPQQLAGALAPLCGRIPAGALLLSVVAGARAASIGAAARHDRIVRAMPNIPARVGASATVWWATPEVPAELIDRARALLGVIGLEVAVAAESDVEIATGLTGPTPAFLYLVIEALVEAGAGLGFPRDAALALTLQTIEGSVALMKQTGEHAAVLRADVTSPGGATAAGLYVLEKAGLRATMIDAVRAVFARARELGGAVEIEITSRDER